MALLTPDEAAKELGISSKQLRELCTNGLIPWIDIGLGITRPCRRFEPSDIELFKAGKVRMAIAPSYPMPDPPTPLQFEELSVPADKARGSYIYFIQGGDLVKIGRARSIKNRMRALQSGSSIKIKLIHFTSGGDNAERALHRKFAKYRSHLEWFSIEGDLLDFLRSAIVQIGGDPVEIGEKP